MNFTRQNFLRVGALLSVLLLAACHQQTPATGATNHAPTANAGAAQTVNSGSPVVLTGSGTDAEDGAALGYAWTQVSGPAPTAMSGANTPVLSFTAPQVTTQQVLAFRLTVTDSGGLTGSATVAVTVNAVPANHAPSAAAGAPQTVDEGAPVTLNGSGLDAEDGTNLTYAWTQTSGPSAAPLTGANTASLSFTAPQVTSQQVLTFTLTVTDHGGLSGTSSTTVTVRDTTITPPANQPPVADAGNDQSAQQGHTVVLDGSASHDDHDTGNLGFFWQQSSGPAVTLNDAHAAVASFTAPTVNAPVQLKFQLVVTDSAGAQGTDETAVTVTPLPPDSTFLQAQCTAQGGPAQLCDVLGQAQTAAPDRLPVLSYAVERGALRYGALPARAPSAKTVDGDISDWSGAATMIGGTARWDGGEYIYTDYLFDAYGADDGDDAQRLQLLDPLSQLEPRTFRLDQLFQAAGDQFDAPRPVGAPDHYGDVTDLNSQADLSEVRWAADADKVYLLARTTTLTDAAKLGVLVLLDTKSGPAAAKDIGLGTGLNTSVFDTAILLTQAGVIVRDIAAGTQAVRSDIAVAINTAGFTNALEAGLPASLFANSTRIAVISGARIAAGITPANVAYRFNEPVAGVYNDKLQALSLLDHNIDAFSVTLQLGAMRGGVSESAAPGPGYHERQFVSGSNISSESGENGVLQPYGLYIPTSYDPAHASALTFWLHYRGGKAHSGAAWTPRLISELGEEQNNIVVTPRGRGTSTWYVTQAHQDFFEVFRDVAGSSIAHSVEVIGGSPAQAGLLNVDDARVRLSGYSMGGYGTYIFGLLYPDLFSAGFSTSGAMTQGAWTGVPPDSPICDAGEVEIPTQGTGNFCFIEANDGNANAQLTYRLLDNAHDFPIMLNHGSNDELVPVTGIQAIGVRLLQLNYRYDLHMFFGYEHYTQAIIDEWGDGAAYLNQFARPANPRKLSYRMVPALTRALNQVQSHGVAFNFNPNRAYWASALAVRAPNADDPNTYGLLSAESLALPGDVVLGVPRVVASTSTPVYSPGEQSTPYARHGLDWQTIGQEPLSNAFNATLTGLSAASLDTARMALKLNQRVDGAVTSDGAATLTLTQVRVPVDVYVNGISYSGAQQGKTLVIPLASGISHIVLLPPGSAPPAGEFGSADLVSACAALGSSAAPLCAQLGGLSAQLVDGCTAFATAAQCALFAGNLHSVISLCRDHGGPELMCKFAETAMAGVASTCRQLTGVPPQFCALINGQLISESQMLAYENGWTARALGLQRQLDDATPLHNALFPHTHNSFNNTTANFPQTLSGSDSNQKYTIRDQLRMGIRAIEVDIHWMPGPEGTPATAGREPMVCHGNANHAGCTAERTLTAVLAEIKGWLDANPGETILLYLEEHLDEAIDDTSVSFDTTAGVIEAGIGGMIYRPAAHGASCNDNSTISNPTAWINLTRAQIRAAGKRLMIFTGSCGVGTAWPALVHNKRDAHYVESGESSYEGYAYPGCRVPADGSYPASDYANKLTRFYEDSTLVAVATDPTAPPRTGVTVNALREMVRCDVNLPGLDQVTPDDPRLPSYVWSWAGGEPDVNPAKTCALHRADGRFVAADCSHASAYACVDDAGAWSIGMATGAWSAAQCPGGAHFAVPRNGNDNEHLKEAKASAGVSEVWLNYAASAGAWTAP